MGKFTERHTAIGPLPTPKMTVWVGGHEKTGKTQFALTAPSPIAWFDLDQGLGRPLPLFQRGEVINALTGEPFKPEVHVSHFSQRWSTQKEFEAELARFERDYDDAISDDGVETIVIDTWAELRGVAVSAQFGPSAQVPAPAYVPVNNRMMKFLDLVIPDSTSVSSPKKHVVLLSHLKERYEQAVDPATGEKSKKISDSYATGTYYFAGHKDTKKKVQTTIETARAFNTLWIGPDGKPITTFMEHPRYGRIPAMSDKSDPTKLVEYSNWRDLEHRLEDDPTGKFYFTIKVCGPNSQLAGQVVEEPLNTFPSLAQMVFPHTELEEWL